MIDHLKILPHLNEKFKLGLDIRGTLVYSNGRPMTPIETKDIFDKYYPFLREEFVFNMILDSFNPKEPVKKKKLKDNEK